MKLRLLGRPDHTFDVPRDVGEVLLLILGTPVERVPDPAPKRVPRTHWSVERTFNTREPFIHAVCASCHDVVNALGPTAHEHKFIHCGVAEPVPTEILQQYLRMLPKPKKLRQVFREALN